VEALYGRAHRYKPTSLDLVARVGTEAMILDVGGGDRHLKLPNFVNFDVIRSGLVDIVGDVHQLPFGDSTFDLILCEAVLEHLRKPWLAVEELYRVLKPRGFVYVDVAFMQPVHAYPNHYFNMTKQGVESLFERFTRVDSGVQEYQMPSYAVVTLLSRYIRSLLPMIDKGVREVEVYDTGTFKTSKLSLPLILTYGAASRFLRFLDRFIKPDKAQEIAAGVYFTGTKQ